MDLNLIGIGIGGSLIAGLTSWFKNASADGKIEAFELRYLAPTLLAGMVSGAAAQIPGIPTSWGLAVAAGGPVLVQNVIKGMARHGGGSFQALGGLKGILGHLWGDLKNPEAKPTVPAVGK